MRQQGLMRRVVLGSLFMLWSFPLFGQSIKIMPLGDSITLGDKSQNNEGYRKDLYTRLTNDLVSVDFVGSLNDGTGALPDKDHEGHPGVKADAILANLSTYLNNVAGEKVILLHIGTNDIVGGGETAAATITEIEGIIDGIKNHDSNIEIFVATLVPADTTRDSEITVLNALIVDLVSVKRTLGYKIFLVDQNGAFKNNANWATQLIFDDVHPTDTGYDLMASTWHQAFMLHSQYSKNNFVDNFNRATLGTSNWTAHNNMQIVSSLELGNTAGIADWHDGTKGYLAMQKDFTDANRVSFTYGAGVSGGVTDNAGVVVLFDSASTTGTGYFINRFRGTGTTSGANSKIRLWRVIDGILQTPNLSNTPYTQGTGQAGDEFTVEIITTPAGHTFKCYLNGVLDGTLTDAALTFNPAVRYSGVMILGNTGAAGRIDNFAIQQAAEDTDPPAAISDLDVGIIGATTVELTWTAPGDDGNNGTALSYEVRFSTSPITNDVAFDLATPASGEPAPQSAGNTEDMVVGNLNPGTLYYFAIKTSDDAGNVSDLSNEVSATTTALIITTDDFNRTGPDLGADWVFDSAYQIVDVGLSPDNELHNSSAVNGEWKLAVFTKRKNITDVSFRWGVGANSAGIENGGPALLLDSQSITANGYMAQWRTSVNQVRVIKIVSGLPDTPVENAAYTGNDPQAGDIVEVKMNTDAGGLNFDFYVNGVYYKRLTDGNEPNFDFNQDLYAGVFLNSGFNNNIDDFTVAVAPGDPASLFKVSGDNPVQSDTVGQKLALPFVVEVRDGGDNPLSNIGINFSVTSGGGALDSPISPDGNIHVEAESGTLTAPMAIVNDSDAAFGKYISSPSTTGLGRAVYVINVTDPGNYRVWGRIIAPDGGSDSFFFKVDNGTQYYWDLPNPSPSWTWDLVNQTTAPTSDPKIFNLSAGNHTITIDTRDGNSRLDKLIFTKDVSFTPSGKEELGFLTNASGQAQATLTLGPNAGPNMVTASYGALTPVVFTANAVGGNACCIAMISGNNQTGAGGAALASPFVVKVTDIGTNPVPGHPVTFVVTQGGGSLSNSQPVLTDASGNASTILTLGREVTTQKVEAQATGLSGSPILFTATAPTGIATTLTLISGNNQTGTVASNLTNPIVVKVTDGTNGIPNYPVEMAVTRGGGTIGASNRVKNGGFENGKSGANPYTPTNWQFLGSPSAGEVDVVTTDKHSGTSSARLNVNASSEGISQPFSLLGNTSYTLVFWAKVSSGTLVARWYVSGPSTIDLQVTAAGNGNTWKKYQISANNVSVSSYPSSLDISGIGSVNGFIDDVQLLQNTDGSGQLSATWTLGDTAMVQQIQALAFANNIALTNSPLSFSATANAGPATNLDMVDGNNQSGSAGSPLVNPLRVRVTDATTAKNPKQGYTVNWSVTAGGGTLPSGVTSLPVVTDANGISQVIPTLGPTPGAINTLRAAATGLQGSPINFIATAVIPDNISITGGNNQIASASLPVFTPLKVRIADIGGQPISGYPVLFEVILGTGKINNLSSTTIMTNANGEAQATLVLGSVPGALNRVRATATFNNAPIAGSPLTFNVTAAKLTTLSIFSGNGQSGAVGLALPQPLKAIVHDSLGNAIRFQTVTFTITGGGGKIDGATTPQTKQTDSLGVAQVTLTLGTTPGINNNTVKAETSSPLTGSPLTFTASATSGAPTTLLMDSGNNQSVVINNQLPLPLKVKVTDSYTNGVPNHPVKFKIKAGGGKVNGADSVTVNTDASGFAQVNMTVGSVSGLNNNICEVTAKNGPVHLTNSPMQFLETATSSTARYIDYISGNGQQGGVVGTPLPNFFVVKVTDNTHNNPVAGHPVTFKVIQGNGRLDGGVDTVKTVTTKANGEAQIKLTLGPVAGATNIVRATSNDGISPLTGSPVDFSAVSVAGSPSATVSTVQATTQVAANGTDTSKVTITVRDNFGNTLPNVAVTIVVGGSNNFIHQPTDLTNANGVVIGGFASTRAEVKTVQAKVIGGVQITNGAQVLFTPLPAENLVYGGDGNNQTSNVGTAIPKPLLAKVTDRFGNAIGGYAVTFSVQSGGGFFAGTQPVLTDNEGIARGIWVLGPNPGSNLANASSNGLNGSPVTYTATGVVSAAANLVEVGVNNQHGVVNQELPDSIVVKVTDNSNRPVFNHPVKFKVIFGGGKVNNLDSTIVQTDAFGLARVAWKMGGQTGSNFCTASATGLNPESITFGAVAQPDKAVSFEITEGQGATNTVATTVGPLKVRVKDVNGNGVSYVQVNFDLTSGTGTLSANQMLTEDGGYAWVFLNFGTNSGPRTVVASANGLQPSSLTFNLTATPGPAKSMAINRGNNQNGTVNKPLNFPLEVIVKDQYSNPVGGTTITFVNAAGAGGNFSGNPTRAVQSNDSGIASAVWTLGSSAGSYQAQALNNNLTGSPLIFGATAFTNNFPIITDVSNVNINEKDHVEFMITATDADGDPMTYGAKNLPTGAVYDSLASHLFSWTTNYNSAGVYNVSFIARDNKGGVDEEVVTIVVNNLNRPPVLVSHNPVRSDTSLANGVNLLMKVNATDADGDALTYAWFDNTIPVSTTTSYQLQGSVNAKVFHSVEVRVSDGIDVTPFFWNVVTKVELSNFSAAVSDKGGVILNWKTTSESSNAGFNVLRSRSQSSGYERLNDSLIRHRSDGEYSFTDRGVEAGARYYYKLQDLDFDGNITEHGPLFIEVALPDAYVLHQNYPNPFNPTTHISFQLPKGGDVTLTIYNMLGQPVRKLVQGQRPAGVHLIEWDGRNDRGEPMASGIYHYRLQAGTFAETKKMLLMK